MSINHHKCRSFPSFDTRCYIPIIKGDINHIFDMRFNPDFPKLAPSNIWKVWCSHEGGHAPAHGGPWQPMRHPLSGVAPPAHFLPDTLYLRTLPEHLVMSEQYSDSPLLISQSYPGVTAVSYTH